MKNFLEERNRRQMLGSVNNNDFIAHIPTLFICQMLAIFQQLNSKGLYLSSQKEKRKSLCNVLVLHKTWNKEVHAVVAQRRQRNTQKRRDARAKLLFCQSKPVAFLPFLLPFPSSLLHYFFLINKDHIPHRHYQELCYTRCSGDPWMLQKKTQANI